jgi:uncharacterized DUF497 family protein
MGDGFRWNDWNRQHIARHGIVPEQAEYVVLNPRRRYPSYEGDGRWMVRGQDANGLYIQVVYVVDSEDETVYVIDARSLTDREKRSVRRRRR